MKININLFISILETEFDIDPKGTLKEETVIASVIEMSSINALIFLSVIKTEFNIVLTAADLINSNTISDLYNVIISKSE